jgi:predicted ATPase
MITRIKIDGFKSLVNTELFLGPFTCIVGANAIGKSNFFDAISFLSKLADKTILEAAKSVRSENQKHTNLRDIFFRSGSYQSPVMRFEIDMLIQRNGVDDLGQTAEATITSLRYLLELQLNDEVLTNDPITIVKEALEPITQTQAKQNCYFDYKNEWIASVVHGRRSTKIPFISTEGEKIKLHQDGNKGRTTDFIAQKMPRTLLSTVTAESPTAFLVRQEMRNWMMLQFEPSALRQPNSVFEVKNAELAANGQNLPATLFRLHSEKKERDVYQNLTNKLKALVDDVEELSVDKDEKRNLLTLQVLFKDGMLLPAQSLSDGTLRFLGLAILEEDSYGSRLICLEEPENGINPKKVGEMVRLLEDMATDTNFEVNDDNPLRQVIINTHSPLVVSNVSDESLYLAKAKEMYDEAKQRKISFTGFSALKSTWKTSLAGLEATSLGDIMTYLDTAETTTERTLRASEPTTTYQRQTSHTKPKRTVKENILQLSLAFNQG